MGLIVTSIPADAHSIAAAWEENGSPNNTQGFYKSDSRGKTPTPTNEFDSLIKNIYIEYKYTCWEDVVHGLVG